jgi:hypothetical protein
MRPAGAADAPGADRGVGFALAWSGGFGTLTSAWVAAFFLAARSGLPTPPWLAPGCLALFAAFATAPFAAPGRAALLRSPFAAPFASLLVLASPVLALVVGPALGALYPPLALFGLWGTVRALRRCTPGELALLALGPPLLALYLFASIFPYPFAHVFRPELAALDGLTGDAILHAALAHLIQAAGRASSGLDGFVPIHYHLGSHAWFAGIGVATGAEPLVAYPAATMIVAVPGLVTALLLAIASLARSGEGVAGRALVALALVLLFDRIGWDAYYRSESHALGLCALLLGLPALFDLAGAPERRGPGDALRVLAALATVAIAAATKVSAGLLFAAVFAWVVARAYGPSARGAALLLLLGAVLIGVLLPLSPRAGIAAPGFFSPLDFYRRFDPFGGARPEPLDPRKAHSSLLLPLLFVATSILARRRKRAPAQAERAAGGSSSGARPRRAEIIGLAWRGRPGPAELVLVATLAALVPGLTVALGHDAWWFQNAAHWTALAFAAAALPLAPPRAARRRALAALGFVVALALGVERVRDLPRRFSSQVDLVIAGAEAAGGRPGALTRGRGFAAALEALSERRPLFPSELAREIAASPMARIAALVGAAKAGAGAPLAVHVPPENDAFWGRQDLCQKRPFLVPALTGVPLLAGIPARCPLIRTWGAFCCRDYDARSVNRPLSPARLCQHAGRRGIATVFVLRSLEEPERNEILRCGGPGGGAQERP